MLISANPLSECELPRLLKLLQRCSPLMLWWWNRRTALLARHSWLCYDLYSESNISVSWM